MKKNLKRAQKHCNMADVQVSELRDGIHMRLDQNKSGEVTLASGHMIYTDGMGNLEVSLISTDTMEYGANREEFFKIVEVLCKDKTSAVIGLPVTFCDKHAKPSELDLARRLIAYKPFTKMDMPPLHYYNLFHQGHNDGIFVEVVLQKRTEGSLTRFMKDFMDYFEVYKTTVSSTPNYRINGTELKKTLENITSQPLDIELPPIIEGYSRYADKKRDLFASEQYITAIVQKNGSSFTFDSSMVEFVNTLTHGLQNPTEKSMKIHQWVTSNIGYGTSKRKPGVKYRGALDVFYDREGVCGESAALQVTLERLVGNRCFIVNVDEKEFGIGEKHACAAHMGDNGSIILIETTPGGPYDVKYTHIKIVSDDHSLAGYY